MKKIISCDGRFNIKKAEGPYSSIGVSLTKYEWVFWFFEKACFEKKLKVYIKIMLMIIKSIMIIKKRVMIILIKVRIIVIVIMTVIVIITVMILVIIITITIPLSNDIHCNSFMMEVQFI